MATQQEILSFIIQTSGDEALVATAKKLRDAGEAGEAASPQVAALVSELEKLSTQNELIATLTKEKTALQETGDALALAKIRLTELQTQLTATTTPSAALERAFAKQTTTVATLDAQYNQHQANLTRTSNALQSAGINTANLDSEQRKIQASLGAVAAEASNLGKNMGTVAVATEEASEKAKKSSSVFGSLRVRLLEIVSVAALVEVALKGIEFGAESIKGAAAVEQSLARVQALAGSAATSFEALDKSVESAAVAVNTSTQVAATGLAALVSQGLSADTAMKLLIPTLQLAKIAQIDVNTAAADVAQTLKAFNIPVAEAGSVIDKLTVASHGAAGGLAGMADAASQLAPDAKALGLNFTQTISILSVLESKGLDTEKAVRGLRTVFQELQNPTSSLRLQLLALGDGTGDFNKAVAALASGTPRAQQALQTLAGPARTLIETLGQAGPDALAKFADGLNHTEGAATHTSAAIDSTLSGAFTKFTNAIDLVGEKLAGPILKPFADEFSKLALEINEFAESDDFNTISQQVSTMAKDAARAFDEFINNVDFKSFTQNAINDLDGLSKSLEALAKNASTIATAVGKTADAIGVAYHGAGAAIDTLVAGGAKFVDTVTNVAQAGDALVEGNEAAAASFEHVHAAVQSIGDEAWEQAKSNAGGFADDVKDLAGQLDQATEATNKSGDAATQAAPKVDQHTKSVQRATVAAKGFTDELGLVPDYLQATGVSAERAAPAIGKASNELTVIGGGPLQNAKKALADASQGFADLQRSGDAAPAALNAASQAVANASRELERLQTAASTASSNLAGSFVTLHIQSQAALAQTAKDAKTAFDDINTNSANTAAGLADRQNAFLSYANSALAAVASLDAGTRAAKENELESIAATLGLTDQLHQLENQANKTSDALAGVGRRKPDTSGLERTQSAADSANKALKGTGESVKSLTDRINDIGTGGFPDLTQALANTRVAFLNVSEAAAKAFDAGLLSDFDQKFDATGIGFARVIGAMNQAASDVNKTIADQRTQLTNEIQVIDQLGTTANKSFGSFGDDAEKAAAQMENLSKLIQTGNYDAGLLGQQDLAKLQQALDAAAQRARSLADAVKQAKDQVTSMEQQLQDDLDSASGNNTAVEDRRFQKQLDDLKAAAQLAGDLNTAEYQQAVANANALHQLKLKQIQQQQDAQNSTNSSGGGATTGTAAKAGVSSGVAPTRFVQHSFATPKGKVNALVTENESDGFEEFIRQLAAQKVNSI